MATEHKDVHHFPALSLTNIQSTSVTGEVARYGGFSFTGGFIQKWELNGNTANEAEVRQVLCTLIATLFKDRSA